MEVPSVGQDEMVGSDHKDHRLRIAYSRASADLFSAPDHLLSETLLQAVPLGFRDATWQAIGGQDLPRKTGYLLPAAKEP